MALMDFKCENCGESFFEILKDVNDKVVCPKCGSENVRKVLKTGQYGKTSSEGCGGNCGACKGCH